MRFAIGILEAMLCTLLVVWLLGWIVDKGALWIYYDVCTFADNFMKALGGAR